MLKRAMDVSVAVLLLVAMSVPMMVVALLVRWTMGAPVFFRQTRPGLHAKPFELTKFRTMDHATDDKGNPLADEARLTPLGRWLRKLSLDELPQFIEVLRGDMSRVGPRPPMMEYLLLYTPEKARRHEVRPGITGWAQVNGRNAQSWEDRLRLDVWYVDHRSLWLDLKILWLTFVKVIRPEGVSRPGHATMPRFTGNRGEPRNG